MDKKLSNEAIKALAEASKLLWEAHELIIGLDEWDSIQEYLGELSLLDVEQIAMCYDEIVESQDEKLKLGMLVYKFL